MKLIRGSLNDATSVNYVTKLFFKTIIKEFVGDILFKFKEDFQK